MKKIIIIATLFFTSTHVFSQKGIDCDMSEVDKLLTPTEKCILECIRQVPLEKYLGLKSIGFFDSLINCSYKSVGYLYESKGYVTTAVFSFSENLQVRFYFKRFAYIKSRTPPGQLNTKLMRKEVPSKLKIFYSVTPFCEIGSLE